MRGMATGIQVTSDVRHERQDQIAEKRKEEKDQSDRQNAAAGGREAGFDPNTVMTTKLPVTSDENQL